MINFLDELSALPANLDAHRVEAYTANFFMPKALRSEYDADESPLWPTPFKEQNLFLEPYKHGFEMTHDLYSVIYKPLVLTLLACQSLVVSGVLAAQALAGCLAFVSNAIPSPVLLDGDESIELDTHEALDKAQGAALQLLASIYILAVCLPVDTISSAVSFVSRSLTSVYSGVVGLLNDDNAPKTNYFS